jgi:uncharacterized repeat protein (TIGR01451 family)
MILSRIPNSWRTRTTAWLSSCALALCCLAGPEALSAHEANHTHPSLAAASLELLKDPGFYGPDQVQQILAGAIDEDDCDDSTMKEHFLNPRTGEGLFFSRSARERADAMWAKRLRGVSQPTGESFWYAGRVLHLLQDMTSPAHVHDDAHAGFAPGGCWFLDSVDDFENWGWKASEDTVHILDYVDASMDGNDRVIRGSQTQDLKDLISVYFGGRPAIAVVLSPGGFVHELASRTYNMTTYYGELAVGDTQPGTELKRMFPSLAYNSGFRAWTIDGAGAFFGVCGGEQEDAWWGMENECLYKDQPWILGSFYIENSGGDSGSLTPVVWEKTGTHPKGPSSTPLLKIYGDNLYPLATIYGAGFLKVFRETVLKPQHFSDVHEAEEIHWYAPYVRYMYLQRVIQGYADGTFRPNATATRAEVLQMSYNGAAEPLNDINVSDPGFADVGPGDWFYPLVANAKAKGFVNGEACGAQRCFRPNDPINRAEAVKLVSAVLRVDVANPGHIINSTDLLSFSDVRTSDWFHPYVYWLVNSELENGFPDLGLYSGTRLLRGYTDGLFHPERLVTRAEMAKLLTHAMLYCEASTRSKECGLDAVISNASQAFANASAGSSVTTLGALYEQVSDPANTNGPEPFHLPGGDSRTVTGPLTIAGDTHDADGDPLFYFWTTDGGSLTTSDPTSFSRVTWTPPVVATDTVFTLHVVRGDRRGLIGTGRFELLVTGTASADPAAGTITSPTGTQTGPVTVSATASDGDGLAQVTATFISGGPELVFCGPDGPSVCTGTNGSWSRTSVNPAAFGASPGAVTMRLLVEDATGEIVLVDTHAFTFSPPNTGPTFKLTIRKEGDGSGTVSGGGVVCGPGCSTTIANLPAGSSVTLTGSAATGSVWVGFGGERCYSSDPCTLTMNSNITLRAAFGLPDAFAIRYSAPSNGDTGVAVSAQINVYFNRDIVAGPNYAGLALRDSGGTPVPFTPVIRSTDRRLVLIPSSNLAPGTSYVTEIPAGAVSDTEGIPLATPYSFAFTAAEAGAPKMYITSYPPHVMEGSEAKVSIWFEAPTPEERTITLTSTPAGELFHPSEVILEAGETLVELQVDSRFNHGSTSPVTATFSASTPGAGQQSTQIIVANITGMTGASLKFQGGSIVDDTDHDGVFEVDETAEILFSVANFGSSTISNVILEFSVINTNGISILGGAPYTCNLGSLAAGKGTTCKKSFGADDDLPTGDYYIEIKGTSSANGFLDQERVHIVNDLQPDFILNIGTFPSAELTPGSTVIARYTARNNTDGFSIELPVFEVTLEMEGTPHPLYRLHANARGYNWNSQSFQLPIVVPPVPGTHIIRARINPPGTGRLLESNYDNNEATVLTLRVAAPNQPPVLSPIPSPVAAQAGRALAFTAMATDPNNNPITYRLAAGAPAGSAIGSTSGVFTWTPACSQGPGTYSLSIIADDGKGGTDTETVAVNVGIETDLDSDQIASPQAAVPGQTIGLTIVAINHGPSCAIGAAVASLFPASLTHVSWSCTASAGSSCAAGGTGNIEDASVSLLPGGMATYAVTAKVATASGLIFSSATVTAPPGATDPNETNNSSSATISLRGLDFHTVTPCRVFDTRLSGPALSEVTRVVQIAGLCGIPVDAGAVSLNLTAVAPSSSGQIVLFPGNEPVPATSSVSFKSGSTRANSAVLLLATDASGTLAAQASLAGGGQVHLVIDVNGFFK